MPLGGLLLVTKSRVLLADASKTPIIRCQYRVEEEMEILPRDPWALFSRKAGVCYASCILVVLAVYAYRNRIAPVAGTVSIVVLILVFAAFLLLAGTKPSGR